MQDNINILSNTAPTLTAALKGPFAEIANNYIIETLTGKTDHNGKPSDEMVGELITTSENLNTLKTVDTKFAQEMKRLNVDVFSLNYPDERDQRPSRTPMNPQMILSIVFICFYFLIVSAFFYVEVDDNLNTVKGENSLIGELQILIGVLTAGVGQILSYWFGGIIGRDKD